MEIVMQKRKASAEKRRDIFSSNVKYFKKKEEWATSHVSNAKAS